MKGRNRAEEALLRVAAAGVPVSLAAKAFRAFSDAQPLPDSAAVVSPGFAQRVENGSLGGVTVEEVLAYELTPEQAIALAAIRNEEAYGESFVVGVFEQSGSDLGVALLEEEPAQPSTDAPIQQVIVADDVRLSLEGLGLV